MSAADLHRLHARLVEATDARLSDAVALRHQLHRTPERSGAETNTCRLVCAALPCATQPVAETGAVGRLGPDSGPSVVLRAELDGLPVREATGASYAATNGYMHACGHDTHLAALTAVARAGQEVGLPVGLTCLLQPREETAPSGARDVLASGVLDQLDARAVVAVHLQPQLPRGVAAADPGTVNAGSDEFHLTLTGEGGHGGYPHLTRDPVPALSQTILALLQAPRTAADPMHPAVVTVGAVRAGEAANVIPGTATAHGTIRSFDHRDRDRLHEDVRAIVSSTAAAFGCAGRVDIVPVEPPLTNDDVLALGTREWLKESGLDVGTEFRSCGSDDFSFYGEALPSLMVFLGAESGGPGLHDAAFLPDDSLVRDVAHAMIAAYVAAVSSLD